MAGDVAKSKTYSAEQTEQLVAAYAGGAGESVEALAAKFGKTVRSIVAKLSTEGVYVSKAKTKAASGETVTKADLVAKLAEGLGVEATALESLEKATKDALQILVANLGEVAEAE